MKVLLHREYLIPIIFFIIWVESSVGISRGFAMSYFLLPPVFSFNREYILFCRRNFSFTVAYFFFAARIFLLPRRFFFCRDYLSFAARIFLLPRVFFFCPDLFLFCRQHFSFTAGISLLPEAFFFCRDTWGPPYEGHENHLQIVDSL